MVRPIALAIFVSTAAACGPSADALCKEQCDCENGLDCWSNAAPYGFCKSQAASDEQASELLGCSKEYNDLLSCRDATAVCFPPKFITNCDIQENLWNKCMTEAQK